MDDISDSAVASLVARVAELERALAPLGNLARLYRLHSTDYAVLDFAPHARLTVGDLRTALTLLRESLAEAPLAV